MTHIIVYYTDITTVFQKVPDKHELLTPLADIDDDWYNIGVSLPIQGSVLIIYLIVKKMI